ncbi:unnamed protein product [Urochloa decumbens]|uniref:Uncharacterized protein n=1 Tax=Urochloa decumbens TaxID=240449 RepID=A0ABC9FPM9_9POAL
MHVLHRLDVSKHLFCPSTAEAEAAHARRRRSRATYNGGTGGAMDPDERSYWDSSPEDMFVLLHGGGEPGRILHANGAGHATVYDAGSSLYVMSSKGYSFEVLDFGGDGGSSRRRYGFDRSGLKWQQLPPPPLGAAGFHMSAVLNGGGTICFSSMPEGPDTFCFDTASQQWWHAGDWTLPFEGKAEHVPELETWVGFSSNHPHHLCAADLSGAAEAPLEGPKLQHVWEDFDPPPTEETSIVLNEQFPGIVHTTTLEWSIQQLHLVNLGSGRFCVAKVFEAEETVSLSCCLSDDDFPKLKDRLKVLIGVEVVRDGAVKEEGCG